MLAGLISNINCKSGNLRLIVPVSVTNKLSHHCCLLIIRGEMPLLAKHRNIWVTPLGRR